MTNKKSYRVPKELKEQILERIKTSGLPVAKIAEEHGITPATIYSWLSRKAEGVPSKLEVLKLQKENKQLLELVGRLTVQLSTSQKKTW